MGTLAKGRSSWRLGLLWERHHPAAVGFLLGCGYVAAGKNLMAYMVCSNWQIGSIYSSVFDLASVFTAFLLTFYTLVVTTERGFIARMKGTRAYNLMKQYAINALLLGGITIAASIPFMIVEPKPLDQSSAAHYLVAAWFGLSTWTILAFVRAARLFVEFIRQHD